MVLGMCLVVWAFCQYSNCPKPLPKSIGGPFSAQCPNNCLGVGSQKEGSNEPNEWKIIGNKGTSHWKMSVNPRSEICKLCLECSPGNKIRIEFTIPCMQGVLYTSARQCRQRSRSRSWKRNSRSSSSRRPGRRRTSAGTASSSRSTTSTCSASASPARRDFALIEAIMGQEPVHIYCGRIDRFKDEAAWQALMTGLSDMFRW